MKVYKICKQADKRTCGRVKKITDNRRKFFVNFTLLFFIMTKLYSTLADVYHDMYQHIFDYEKEYGFYDSLLKKNNCTKILEIACGSGMLARRFLDGGYDYTGVDLHEEMLSIARQEIGKGRFLQCDMRNLPFSSEFDSVLITGRSLAYVTENKGIMDTFKGVHNVLSAKGLFVFGVHEAGGIFGNLDDFEQTVVHNGRKIRRISKLSMNLATGWTYDWHATYIIEQEGNTREFDDKTTLRAFTQDEVCLFLELTGFALREIIGEARTFTVIAEKG
jgi:SAM-dependent methyltransferase